jgi:hypothetical protein
LFIPNLRRLSRRRFLSLAAAAAGAALIGESAKAQTAVDITSPVPYFAQGGTGKDSGANCGPATVASAVNYSGVASPTVQDVRATLGMSGPTSLDQWAWLLDAYAAPWFPIWSQPEMDQALRTGHAIVIAAWMADLPAAPDYEEAYSPFWGQSGRYDAFSQGHALLVVGIADEGANYLIHDPNVFPGSGTYFYGDGAPKGVFRRYSAPAVWNTIGTYADGLGLAVAPQALLAPAPAPAPESVKRVRPDKGELFAGPGGGHAPERGERGLTGVIVPQAERGVISAASDDGDTGG